MTQPLPDQLAVAARMGRRSAEAGRPVTDCPYNADGTPAEKALARRWVHEFLGVREPMSVSYDG